MHPLHFIPIFIFLFISNQIGMYTQRHSLGPVFLEAYEECQNTMTAKCTVKEITFTRK